MRERLAEVEAAEQSERAGMLAKLVSSANTGCKPLHDLWGRVRDTSAADKDDALIDGAPPALLACRCLGVDVDLLEATTLRVLGGRGPLTGWLPLTDGAGLVPPTPTWPRSSRS